MAKGDLKDIMDQFRAKTVRLFDASLKPFTEEVVYFYYFNHLYR